MRRIDSPWRRYYGWRPRLALPADLEQDAARRPFRSAKRGSIRRDRTICIRIRSTASSSIRCIPTAIWRDPTRSCRTPRRRCPRSPPTGRPGRSRSSPASISPTTPRSRGKKRELTAADYVYSWKRAARSEGALDGGATLSIRRVVGAAAAIAAAKKTGKFDYDAPLEGLQAIDRYTIAHQATAPRLRSADESDGRGDIRGRARGGRGVRRPGRPGDGQSGGHRAVPAQGVAARAEDHAGGESRISRRDLPGQQRSGRPGRRRADARQEAAGDRTRRDQHSRGGQSPPARLRKAGPRLPAICRRWP